MREIFNFNFEWTFFDGDVTNRNFNNIGGTEYKDPQWTKAGNNAVSKIGYDARSFEQVDLPHDFVVRRGEFSKDAPARQGCLKKGVVWYRKAFEVSNEDKNKHITIEFDGVYRNCQVFLNGHFLKRVVSGYQSFEVCLDDTINYGETNIIAVFVDATEYEGWWYEGGGIYRNTRMVKTDKLHIKQWGAYVVAEVKDNLADVSVETTINNIDRASKDYTCLVELFDMEGSLVATTNKQLTNPAYETIIDKTSLTIDKPHLWSIDDPYLYNARITLQDKEVIIDTFETTFGARYFNFDTERGFILNGEEIKLKGVCCHEDHACVGVANPDEVNRFRIQALKDMGVNAYRSSHNPPTPSLLKACDELGMVVMDETRLPGTTDEQLDELTTLILRDRNHPSIIMWSLGNEEMNIQGTEIGIRIFDKMNRLANQLDPSRLTTYAMNGSWEDYIAFNESEDFRLDVQSLNYCMLRDFSAYDRIHNKFPNLSLCGSENASTLTTRGLYEKAGYVNDLNLYGKFKKISCFTSEARPDFVSGYGEVYPIWGSTPEETWKSVSNRPFIAGIFLWTGFDYRGETTPYNYPAVLSNFGIMDNCGFPKDTYFYYQSVFRSDINVLHLFPTWDFTDQDGEDIEVVVHTNCDYVELYLNNTLIGKSNVARDDSFTQMVPFEKGELMVKGYKDGKLVETTKQVTPKEAHHIELTTHKDSLDATNEDVMIISAKLVDEDGHAVNHNDKEVNFSIEGPYKLLGVGNGHPVSHEKDYANHRRTFHGLCQLMVASTFEPGTITVTASIGNLNDMSITFDSQNCATKPYIPYGNIEEEVKIIEQIRKDIDSSLDRVGSKNNEKNEVL